MRAVATLSRRVAAAAVLVASACLAGCSSGASSSSTALQPMRWERVQLPGGVTPVTVTPMGDKLLVGARDESAHLAPRLLVLDKGEWSSIALHPESYYAYRARWRSVATDGRRIFAVGDAPGGAHSNPRWTTWAGTVVGVREHPQTFETFGGWGAGGITGMTLFHDEPQIVGSWTSESSGLDIAVWTAHGEDWSRLSSSGSALASSRRALTIVRAVGEDRAGTVLAGAIVRLGGGEVALEPAVWRRRAAPPTWFRVDLPADGAGEATGAQCAERSCMAAGYVDDALAVWSVEGSAAEPVDDLPDVPVSEDSVALVGPTGSSGTRGSAVLTTSAGRSVIVTQDSERWVVRRGPVGTAAAWALVADRTYAITKLADGTSALWVGDLH